MDSILRKFENRMDIIGKDHNGYDKLMINSLSYCLNLCLGFLWQQTKLTDDEKKLVISFDKKNVTEGDKKKVLDKLFTGEKDELTKQLISSEGLEKLGEFVMHRNQYAHSFIFIDVAQENFVDDMIQVKKYIPMLSSEKDISFVVLMRLNEKTGDYEAWRYTSDGSLPTRASISPRRIREDGEVIKEFPRTYMELGGKYYMLSPFVHIDPIADQTYVFSSLLTPENGRFKLSALYPRSDKELTRNICFCEFKTESAGSFDKAVTDPGTGISISKFKPNYIEDAYVDNITGIEERIKSQVSGTESRSSVICTIWGHGGVGKTACVQHIIKSMAKDRNSQYEVIVFVSAKNREFDIVNGSVNTLNGAIYGCDDVVREIMRVWQHRDISDDELEGAYDEVANYGTYGQSGRLLLVIDDFETIPDAEKEKVFALFGRASAEYVKVLITTRNKGAITSGTRIDVSELNLDDTRRFIREYIKNLAMLDGSFNSISDNLKKLTSDADIIKDIYAATKGRLIALRYVCNELRTKSCEYNDGMDKFISELERSGNMMRFLYGYAFEQMGEDGAAAEKVFAAISGIVDVRSLEFDARELVRMLDNICDDLGENRIYKLLSLLEDWKLIDVIQKDEDKPVRARLSENTILSLCDDMYDPKPDKDQNQEKEQEQNSDKYALIREKAKEYFVERAVDLRRDANLGKRGPKDLALMEVAAMRAAPTEIRRWAIQDGAAYLESNPKEWKKFFEIGVSFLPDDEELNCDYVYKLWGKRSTNAEFAEEAIDFSKHFFEKQERGVNDRKPWQYPEMYALRVNYRLLYELLKNRFIDEEKNLLINAEDLSDKAAKSLENLYNNFGHNLAENPERYTYKDKENTRLGQTCLTIGLILQLIARNSKYKDIGINMCNNIAPENADDPNPYRISPNDIKSFDKLRKILQSTVSVNKTSKAQQLPQELIGKEVTFHADEFMKTKDGKVCAVRGHLVEEGYTATIGIKDVANRFIKNLENEFVIGNEYLAKVIEIYQGKSYSLSTKDFRK